MFREGIGLPRASRSLRKAASLTLTASLLASLVATGVGANSSQGVANAAGAAGAPRYQVYPAPNGLGTDSGEPSIGVDWNTGNVMYQASLQTLRVSFNDSTSPADATWVDKSAPNAIVSLDPILFTDSRTGRTFTSQLTGQDSLSAYTDDDGENYTPSQGGGIPSGVDHQTIGAGPYAPGYGLPLPVGYQHAVYYCSQDVAAAFCARSDNGGLTYGAGVPIYTAHDCNGIHGHVKVAADGTVYVPNNNCGFISPLNYSGQGLVVSRDNGLTWTVHQVVDANNPGVEVKAGDSDPSVGIGSGGRVYFGFQNKVNENGLTDSPPFIGVSDDHGQTFHNIQRVGTEYGINNIVFPEVVAGDNDRAAFAFLGTPTGGDYQATGVFQGVWHMYVASTFDGGQTWSTVDVTPNDPVQKGSICTGGTTCGNDRNLLDFNDITIDAQGRVLVAFADGCIGGCVTGAPNSYSALATIARQSGGKRLLAQFDPSEPAAPGAPLLSGSRDSSGVHLTWPVPDNGGSPITGYKVYKGSTPGGETYLATVTGTSYDDTTANPANTYYYKVSAVNAVGESALSPEVAPLAAVRPNVCSLPGALASQDDSDNAPNTPPDPSVDVKSVYVAEPYFADGSNKLVFSLNLGASNGTLPASSQWYILWNRPSPDANADRNYVAMKTDAAGTPSFEYGQVSPPNFNMPTRLGAADGGRFVPGQVSSTAIITVSDSVLDNVQPGYDLPQIQARTFYARPDVGAPISQAATSDYSAPGNYTLQGNASCRPASNPDLTVTNLSATQNRPGTTNLAATIANNGTANAKGVVVGFYDGSSFIGYSTPAVLAGGASTTVYLDWNTRSQNGSHTVAAVADPNNRIAESNENNNRAQRVITIRGNKVTNGSFEQSSGSAPTSWTGSQGTAYSSNPANASDGTHSVSATGTGGPAAVNNPSWTSAPINVAPGQTLNVAAAVSTVGVSTSPVVQVVYLDATGHILNTINAITSNFSGSCGAQQLLGQITVPQGVSQLRIKLAGFNPTDPATRGTVYFDDAWVW
jgi:hypothetical protein